AAADKANLFPNDRLPCPGCAASLKGANLADHVRRTHMADDQARRRQGRPGRPGQVGRDRRIRRTGWVLVILWLAGLAGLIRSDPSTLTDAWRAVDAAGGEPTGPVIREHLELIARSSFGIALLAGLGVILVALVMGRSGRVRARVEVADRAVVLHHRLGTGTTRVALPAHVESGSLIRHVGGSGGDETGSGGDPGYDEHVGTYLRLGTGLGAITVGCPSSTKVRKHWEGWAPAKQRTRWDITLAPAEFVAFQYDLAARGVLLPRPS
ncbi:MAG TPA: hypothetical protein VK507_03340, partial [Iamia sp.]|nr:hypothetical protein [Iamia sp.]